MVDRDADFNARAARAVRELNEVIAHLGAARMQRLPEDDTIISGHIDKAYAAAKAAWRRLRRRPGGVVQINDC